MYIAKVVNVKTENRFNIMFDTEKEAKKHAIKHAIAHHEKVLKNYNTSSYWKIDKIIQSDKELIKPKAQQPKALSKMLMKTK